VGSDLVHRDLKLGLCGFRLSLAEYVKRFEVVEVQITFYQPPQIKTLERWRAESPDGFEFTVKTWQLVTHESTSPTYRRLKRKLSDPEREDVGAFKPTEIVREAWQTTLACADALRAKRVLIQCPARFTPTATNVANFSTFMREARSARDDLIFVWEPRGNWPDDLVRDLCNEFRLVHVVDPLAARSVTEEKYYRLHGRRGRQYSDDEFEELYKMLPADRLTYVMFNQVNMVRDAERFQRISAEIENEE
jgi:uncharacterized protein YecE (DUF72 family)